MLGGGVSMVGERRGTWKLGLDEEEDEVEKDLLILAAKFELFFSLVNSCLLISSLLPSFSPKNRLNAITRQSMQRPLCPSDISYKDNSAMSIEPLANRKKCSQATA
jgi:hypothetical protein